jgi:DNA repair protein RadC
MMGRDTTATTPALAAPATQVESAPPRLVLTPRSAHRRGWATRRTPRLADTLEADRPREKLLARGPSVLSDAELLAIIVGSGTRERDALAIAADVQTQIGLPGTPPPPLHDLASVAGVGSRRAAAILAALELGRRRALSPETDPPAIGGPSDVFILAREIRERRREHFLVFYLDARHRVQHAEVISIGTLNASIVHPREVYSPAIARPAASLVLCHNHPSGETTPSDDDVAITRRLVQSGELLGIPVLDHVVVGRTGWTSFREARLM